MSVQRGWCCVVFGRAGPPGAVDEWEQGRIVEIRAEGERRRHEHRQVGAAAVSRMQARGEALAAIADLAGVKVSHVRTVLKSTNAQPLAAPDTLGAVRSAGAAAENGAVGAHSVSACAPIRGCRCGSIHASIGLVASRTGLEVLRYRLR